MAEYLKIENQHVEGPLTVERARELSVSGQLAKDDVIILAITDEIERQAHEAGDHFVRTTFTHGDDSAPTLKPNIIAFDGSLDVAKIAAVVLAVQ